MEIKKELKQENVMIKANAVSKLTYVSVHQQEYKSFRVTRVDVLVICDVLMCLAADVGV